MTTTEATALRFLPSQAGLGMKPTSNGGLARRRPLSGGTIAYGGLEVVGRNVHQKRNTSERVERPHRTESGRELTRKLGRSSRWTCPPQRSNTCADHHGLACGRQRLVMNSPSGWKPRTESPVHPGAGRCGVESRRHVKQPCRL